MIGLGLTELLLIPFAIILYIVPIAIFALILYYVIKKAVKNAILEAQEEIKTQKSGKNEENKNAEKNEKSDENINYTIRDETKIQENEETEE